MATIDISRAHDRGKEGAREAATSIAEKLKSKLDVTYEWHGDELRFSRTGAKGRIVVSDSDVRVVIDLGLALRPLKGRVTQRTHDYLDEAFGR